ncbi:MAG: ribonuclease P protein component [Alphaproteobacteria bacterium]|nr:ribonuclease P protein component [Alphaproteobacteria bacterium]
MSAASRKLEILKKRAEFLSVAANGKKWVAPGFILQIGAEHDPAPNVRLGFTASGRIGNAVTRNRAKRRLRALAAELMPHACCRHDYVLIARPTTPVCAFEKLRDDLTKGLKKLKLWRS